MFKLYGILTSSIALFGDIFYDSPTCDDYFADDYFAEVYLAYIYRIGAFYDILSRNEIDSYLEVLTSVVTYFNYIII